MKSSTRDRVVKSYEVAVSGPRLVESDFTGFKYLSSNLAVLTSPQDAQANAEVERALADAEAEAEARRLISEAQAKAEEITKQAEAEAEAKREQIAIDIRAQIAAEAYQAGYQNGWEQANEEASQIRLEAQSYLALAQNALQEEYAKVDESLLELSLRIAERVTRAALVVEPAHLLNIVRALVLLPQERDGWRLHLAPEDWEWLSALPKEEQPPCLLVRDETLQQGDCFLECQEGVFDARFEAQLTKLSQLLQEELKHGGLEQASQESGED